MGSGRGTGQDLQILVAEPCPTCALRYDLLSPTTRFFWPGFSAPLSFPLFMCTLGVIMPTCQAGGEDRVPAVRNGPTFTGDLK